MINGWTWGSSKWPYTWVIKVISTINIYKCSYDFACGRGPTLYCLLGIHFCGGKALQIVGNPRFLFCFSGICFPPKKGPLGFNNYQVPPEIPKRTLLYLCWIPPRWCLHRCGERGGGVELSSWIFLEVFSIHQHFYLMRPRKKKAWFRNGGYQKNSHDRILYPPKV